MWDPNKHGVTSNPGAFPTQKTKKIAPIVLTFLEFARNPNINPSIQSLTSYIQVGLIFLIVVQKNHV